MNEELYNELVSHRNRLKEMGKMKTGRAPLVCNDEALVAIATMCPRKLEDLEGIPGIGRTFIDNYGKEFVDIVNKYDIEESEKTFDMNDKVTETLKELEKKLVNINRRNRLLFMPKLASKYGFDLINSSRSDILDVILGGMKNANIMNLMSTNEKNESKAKGLITLLREINSGIREKGQNDLYVGYPYVIGRIPGEKFDVRCPLALFPVEAERNGSIIRMNPDESRDILYNSTFLLAYYKFNGINKPLPQVSIEEVDKVNFIDNLLAFYEENGIHIELRENADALEKFVEYKAAEFPDFKEGELYLENNAILGKFPVCSSSIQKDFDNMIESGQINNLLNELLLEVNDIDFYSDSYSGEDEKIANEALISISEKNLTYINALDSSQENVLTLIDKSDKLVVQGPPGTGKSQVITSLIAKFANAEKNVLMVSEKKTALDVVYSRLGDLSKYALLIDDVSNKDLFYKQLEKMIILGKEGESENNGEEYLSRSIDEKIRVLENIANKLYKPNEFGIEPYKLYVRCQHYDLTNQEMVSELSKLNSYINENILKINYADIKNAFDRFSNETLNNNIITFNRIKTNYPWINQAVSALGQFELMSLNSEIDEFRKLYEENVHKNSLARFFGGFKVKKCLETFLRKYMQSFDKLLVKRFLDNPLELKMGFESYLEYQEVLAVYGTLSENERIYGDILYHISKYYESGIIANNSLYNGILYKKIDEFEKENRDILSSITNYKEIVFALAKEIESKKDLTRKSIENILSLAMGNITFTKRNGEIRRVVESKRKMSVNRFISKYGFELFKGVKIWLLTPEVVSEILPLEAGLFDLVIFDEASQMYVEKGLPSILRAKKVVIAGDHKQLRPSNLGGGRVGIDEEELGDDDEISAALEEESLLDLARFKYQDVMLNYHYRSKYEELIAFSNYAFYKGRLYVSPNVEKCEKAPIEFHKMEDALWQNRTNIVEAKYIVSLLKDILNNRENAETIGIITFNTNQREKILDLIDDECNKDAEFAAQIRAEMDRKQDGEDIGLFVKNIESVQGDERDIIIFSIGYAKNSDGRLIRNFGWLNQKGGENRLNVAISRGKRKIHVVASFMPEELQVEDTKNDGPRILKKYLQYAKAVSDGDEETVKQILNSFGDEAMPGENISFDSDFEMQVYDGINRCLNEQMSDMDYKVDTQIGVGGYSIDLAIKRGDKYILGIECDGKTYHSSKSARERDYHRQKYLESRGWKIHRIWSTNWWKNEGAELEKICGILRALENE